MVIIKIKYAAYDSYARLGLDSSARIVCQITSDALKKIVFNDRLLVVNNRAPD